jgi:hypothetical protein
MSSLWLRGLAGLALTLLAAGTPPQAAGQCMTVLGRVSDVTGNPFQAEVNTKDLQFSQSRPKPVMVARDSQGRVRIDNSLGTFKVKAASGQEAEVDRHSIEICDPVSGETITLDTLNKTATVQHLPSLYQRSRPMSGLMRSFCELQLHLGASDPNVELVDLGHRTIEGTDAHGVMERRTNPAATGSIGSVNNERQLWCAEELEVMILLVMDTPEKKDLFHFAMTSIQRGEPPAGLFAIPADYEVLERENIKTPD